MESTLRIDGAGAGAYIIRFAFFVYETIVLGVGGEELADLTRRNESVPEFVPFLGALFRLLNGLKCRDFRIYGGVMDRLGFQSFEVIYIGPGGYIGHGVEIELDALLDIISEFVFVVVVENEVVIFVALYNLAPYVVYVVGNIIGDFLEEFAEMHLVDIGPDYLVDEFEYIYIELNIACYIV